MTRFPSQEAQNQEFLEAEENEMILPDQVSHFTDRKLRLREGKIFCFKSRDQAPTLCSRHLLEFDKYIVLAPNFLFKGKLNCEAFTLRIQGHQLRK